MLGLCTHSWLSSAIKQAGRADTARSLLALRSNSIRSGSAKRALRRKSITAMFCYVNQLFWKCHPTDSQLLLHIVEA